MGKKLLTFVYDNKNPWMDGLYMAVKKLEQDFEVSWINLAEKEEQIPADFTLGWGGLGSKVDEYLEYIPGKKGLCIGGNAINLTRTEYDIMFYETDWVREALTLEKFGCKLVKAFGINDAIFNKIDIAVPVVWDYIGVGAFASWKRWYKMTAKTGNRLVVGEYQLGNEEESLQIIQTLVKGGVMVSPMVHPFDLANLYHWSRTLFLPADIYGGGERAILEARACGLKIEIEDDNPKLKELLDCKIPTSDDYYKSLKKGILSCLK
jgi:hypothetical protein